MTNLTLLLAASLCVGMVLAHPDGAPVEACADMTPGHGHEPLPLPSPYAATLNLKRVQPRADVILTISAAEDDIFIGFFVQARDDNGVPVGTFEVDDDVQVIDCPGGSQNAATHVSDANKTSVAISYIASSTPTLVTFTITTLREFDEIWVGQTVPLLVTYDLD